MLKFSNIFSIKNDRSNEYSRKVITIFGIKIAFKGYKKKYKINRNKKKKLLNIQKLKNELILINNDSASKHKILHYSSYGVKCGIATFCDYLLEGLVENNLKYNAILPFNKEYLEDKELIYNYLNKFIEYSKSFDTIFIQHEYAFWNVCNYDTKSKIDKFLFLNNFGMNQKQYGLSLFDYLVEKLLKLDKSIKIVWHTDFEKVLASYKSLKYSELPFFRFLDNPKLKVVVLNSKMLSTLEKYNIPTNNVIFITHPIDNKIAPVIHIKNDNKIILGSFGFLFGVKGVVKILDTLQLLPENFEYIHIGGPHSSQNSDILEYYMGEISKRNLEKRAKITGFVDDDKLKDYFSLIDLGLYLIDGDHIYGSGSITHFLQNEIPTLTTKGANFVDLSKKYDCIELINCPFEPKYIAEEIQSLINNKERLKQLKENCAKIRQENSYKNFIKVLMNINEDV